MSLEMRREILRLLKSGPKTPDELRKGVLGNKSDGEVDEVEHKTRYQAYRRAVQSLVEDGSLEDAKYRLRGDTADQKFKQSSMQRFTQTEDPARHTILMEDIEVESRKREAILTPRLLVFLEERLDDKTAGVRQLAVSCLRQILACIDESHLEEKRHLKRLRGDYTDRLLRMASEDESPDVRIESLRLLIEFGEPRVIETIKNIVASSFDVYRQFELTLRTDLCRAYDASAFSKNRLLRDRKDRLAEMLANLRLKGENTQIQKRAELLLQGIRLGRADRTSEQENAK